jgi:type II secretory pathway component PulF
VITALLYPALLLFFVRYVYPVLVAYLHNMFLGANIPIGRMIVYNALDFASLLFALYVLTRLGVVRAVWDLITPHVWPFLPIVRRFALARFFRALGLFLASGLGTPRSIERAAEVTGNPFMRRSLLNALKSIRNGSSLTDALSVSRYVSADALAMLKVGEESGKLDETLARIATYKQEEAVYRTRATLYTAFGILFFLFAFFAVSSALGGGYRIPLSTDFTPR